MNLKQIKFDGNRIIGVGRCYTSTDKTAFTVERIWSDKYVCMVSYRLDDGRPGDTSPNSMYHWINWAA